MGLFSQKEICIFLCHKSRLLRGNSRDSYTRILSIKKFLKISTKGSSSLTLSFFILKMKSIVRLMWLQIFFKTHLSEPPVLKIASIPRKIPIHLLIFAYDKSHIVRRPGALCPERAPRVKDQVFSQAISFIQTHLKELIFFLVYFFFSSFLIESLKHGSSLLDEDVCELQCVCLQQNMQA